MGMTSRDAAHYPLSVLSVPEADDLNLVFEYRPPLLERAAVERISTLLVRALQEIVLNIEQPRPAAYIGGLERDAKARQTGNLRRDIRATSGGRADLARHSYSEKFADISRTE
jgi:hypothetical protein